LNFGARVVGYMVGGEGWMVIVGAFAERFRFEGLSCNGGFSFQS